MFDTKTICLLGRQPELGIAELESLYGAENLRVSGNNALLNIPAEDINFKRLGGTIKVARVLAVLPYTNWPKLSKYLKDEIPKHVAMLPEGKITIGLSLYDIAARVDELNKTLLNVKKSIKASGRPIRVLQNKELELSSAQVFHNKLTHRGAWELLMVRDGDQTYLAQTLFVQDISAYAARDQKRPKRDSRVGMLPPKLAQIIVNLSGAKPGQTVLDPFCGTGVLLQESLLMGINAYGTDLEPRMIEYSKANLDWLVGEYPGLTAKYELKAGDATDFEWTNFDCVASEVYLGRPFSVYPAETDLKQAVSDVNTITKKFLTNLGTQMRPGQTVCLAVPAWRKPNGGLIHLPLLDHLTEMGYNYWELKHVPKSKLVYYREDQVVARELIRLEKQ